MADIRVFKNKVSKACVLIRSHEAQMDELLQSFEFPNEKSQCEEFIRAKTADLNNLSRGITRGMQILEKYIKEAMEKTDRGAEPMEQEKLMLDLNKHLEDDSNDLEILTIQWLNNIEFRLEELTQQATLIATPRNSSNGTSDQDSHFQTRVDRCQRIRRPSLEVPAFSGDFREFATFWSVFKSLVHDDAELSDQEKFLFLKQALKGKAATSVRSIPVIGERYHVAVNILKKEYDRSSSMADILISEIERIPRANDNPKSCRETLSAISSRIIHPEQTAVSFNAERVWRRLILSKFTEHICSTVTRKESHANFSFEVKDIVDAIGEIITLQETTELTTRTLFGTENRGSSNFTSPLTSPLQTKNAAKRRITPYESTHKSSTDKECCQTKDNTVMSVWKTSPPAVLRRISNS
ncbi:unnamed protein product [Nippostrongylus brasiliensis]|uniref:DUF1758 domain-containing protein n=1 Tax=Nippostrongylus brasiliensis TaxID=27835 RepID=A0A0N4XJK5_NIPBR|nr:unnamed protein product [Nippostrongylus brasiliensis]